MKKRRTKRKNPKISKDLVSLLNTKVRVFINKESQLSNFICEGIFKYNPLLKMYGINYDIPDHKYKFSIFFRLSEIDNISNNNIYVKLTIKNKKEKLPLVKLSGKHIYVIFGNNLLIGLLRYNDLENFYFIQDPRGQFFLKFKYEAINSIQSESIYLDFEP